ncbi:hypothetical protein PC119_g17173 [Phytophthora cactorum]|nr:hypothetical protein PC114_g26017 [Phytophthora cactorum]KAG2999562.1 hypothetical protein PC119_g17173 [Phytophthora cactorum]
MPKEDLMQRIAEVKGQSFLHNGYEGHDSAPERTHRLPGAQPKTAALAGPETHATDEIDALPSSELIGDNLACEPVAITDEEVPEAPSEELSGYIGSSAPTMFPSPDSTPGSKCPYSRASKYGTAISEDSVECLGSVGPAKNPVRARYWLSWFNGYEVHVPATGQCAILDLYASATNHSRTQIELSREVIRDANRREKVINDLMITNLMDDVKLGSVNPEKEFCRLNPDAETTSNPNVALAQYCTHLLHELVRPVYAPTPNTYWTGPNKLRAGFRPSTYVTQYW